MIAGCMQAVSHEDRSFRPDINALRALAVAAVIAFHFGLPGFASGYVGVDIFFVISGFLIGGHVMAQLGRARFSLKHFFAGRIRRIVPALAVTCAAVLAWGWAFQAPPDYKALARSATNAVQFLANSYFADQLGYFDLGAAYKPLLHTWSLAVEAQFYLFLPFVLIGLWKLPPRWRVPLLALLGAASFAGALHWGVVDRTHVFYSFTARAWEFLVGCLAACVPPVLGQRLGHARRPLLGLAWIALAATCLLLPQGIAWPGAWTLVPTLLTAAVIVLGTGHAHGRLVQLPPVQHAGTISYSLYLWHWPLLVAWRLTLVDTPVEGWAVLPLLAATWACGWLSWRFAEQPLRTRAGWGVPARLFRFYGCVVLLAMVFAVWMSKTDGLPERLPAYAHGAVLASLNEAHPTRCRRLPGVPANDPDACDVGRSPPDAPTFAVWGDSHALQYLDALREAADRSGAAGQLFHFPGCEPAAEPGGFGGAACDAHNAQVLGAIDGTPSIRTVLVVLRQNDPHRVDRAWRAVDALVARGLRVVVLGPTPEAHRAVAQEWLALELLHRRPVPEMSIGRGESLVDARTTRPVDPYDVRLARWQAQARAAQARHGDRIQPIDLTPLFCDDTRCWLVRGGVGMLRDTDHLTTAAARRVLALAMPSVTGMQP